MKGVAVKIMLIIELQSTGVFYSFIGHRDDELSRHTDKGINYVTSQQAFSINLL